MTISIIVAMGNNEVIGNSQTNDMPWGRSIPEDLQFFREQTIGQTVVYGKRTFESMNSKPLPNRINIVLGRNSFFNLVTKPPVYFISINSIEDLLDFHDRFPKDKIFICGGANVYSQFLDTGEVDEIIVTHIDGNFEGDVFFPLSFEHLNSLPSELIKEVPVSETNPYALKMVKYFNRSY